MTRSAERLSRMRARENDCGLRLPMPVFLWFDLLGGGFDPVEAPLPIAVVLASCLHPFRVHAG